MFCQVLVLVLAPLSIPPTPFFFPHLEFPLSSKGELEGSARRCHVLPGTGARSSLFSALFCFPSFSVPDLFQRAVGSCQAPVRRTEDCEGLPRGAGRAHVAGSRRSARIVDPGGPLAARAGRFISATSPVFRRPQGSRLPRRRRRSRRLRRPWRRGRQARPPHRCRRPALREPPGRRRGQRRPTRRHRRLRGRRQGGRPHLLLGTVSPGELEHNAATSAKILLGGGRAPRCRRAAQLRMVRKPALAGRARHR